MTEEQVLATGEATSAQGVRFKARLLLDRKTVRISENGAGKGLSEIQESFRWEEGQILEGPDLSTSRRESMTLRRELARGIQEGLSRADTASSNSGVAV